MRLIRDSQQNIEKLQIVGIDNDRALAQPFVRKVRQKKQIDPETKEVTETEVKYHFIGIKCILFLLDAMNGKIPSSLKDRLTSRSPMEWLLDYAKILYDHSERMQELSDQHVLLPSDLREQNQEGLEQKALDIPLELDPLTFPRLYSQLSSLLTALNKIPNPTLAEIFEAMHPVLFKCYGEASHKYPDPMTAYGEIHRGLQVEQLFDQMLK